MSLWVSRTYSSRSTSLEYMCIANSFVSSTARASGCALASVHEVKKEYVSGSRPYLELGHGCGQRVFCNLNDDVSDGRKDTSVVERFQWP